MADQSGFLLHQAFFWLHNSGSAPDRAALLDGLRTLADIPQIRKLSLWVPADIEARDVVDGSFDVLETMIFDSLEDQKIYQDHPVHQAFIARCRHLWSRVVVYDSVSA